MSFWAVGIAIVSTAVTVYYQEEAADAAEEQADYNSKLAENAADLKELENHESIRRKRMDKRRRLALAQARLAANGAAVGEGSAMDVMEVLDSRLETEVQDASRQAQNSSQALRQQASNSRHQGEQQSDALRLQSYGTLLDGASTATTRYHSLSNGRSQSSTSSSTN